MNNLKKIIIGIAILSMVTLLNTCTSCKSSSNSKKTNIEVDSLRAELQQIKSVLKEMPTKSDIKIEGLLSEKRMIQASDRKILDVNRQSEIDKEIEHINK